MSTIKLLTGQAIYEAKDAAGLTFDSWEKASRNDSIRIAYEEMAKHLNQDLGLCEECGERPVAPNGMLQIDGNRICFNCCTPNQMED